MTKTSAHQWAWLVALLGGIGAVGWFRASRRPVTAPVRDVPTPSVQSSGTMPLSTLPPPPSTAASTAPFGEFSASSAPTGARRKRTPVSRTIATTATLSEITAPTRSSSAVTTTDLTLYNVQRFKPPPRKPPQPPQSLVVVGTKQPTETTQTQLHVTPQVEPKAEETKKADDELPSQFETPESKEAKVSTTTKKSTYKPYIAEKNTVVSKYSKQSLASVQTGREEQRRRDAEEQRLVVQEQKRRAEERSQQEAEEQRRRDAEEQRLVVQEQKRRAEERSRQEAEEQRRREADEQRLVPAFPVGDIMSTSVAITQGTTSLKEKRIGLGELAASLAPDAMVNVPTQRDARKHKGKQLIQTGTRQISERVPRTVANIRGVSELEEPKVQEKKDEKERGVQTKRFDEKEAQEYNARRKQVAAAREAQAQREAAAAREAQAQREVAAAREAQAQREAAVAREAQAQREAAVAREAQVQRKAEEYAESDYGSESQTAFYNPADYVSEVYQVGYDDPLPEATNGDTLACITVLEEVITKAQSLVYALTRLKKQYKDNYSLEMQFNEEVQRRKQAHTTDLITPWVYQYRALNNDLRKNRCVATPELNARVEKLGNLVRTLERYIQEMGVSWTDIE